jgi:hypothetical protein
MKAKNRRSTVCHNCDSALEESYNFCPVCGQSNTDNNITFWVLMKEFVDNYLGIDSKMAHSFVPFLLRPGTLTNRFQEGRIKHFIHPVRLYLVMSIFYFFTISYLLSGVNFSSLEQNTGNSVTGELDDLMNDERLKLLPDSVKINFLPDSMRSEFSDIETFQALYDSIQAKYGEDNIGGLQVKLNNVNLPIAEGKEPYFERMHRLARDVRISDQAFIDSLSSGDGENNFNFFGDSQTKHLKSQVRKVFVNDEGFKGFVLGNLPLMMFILIPLFAAVLKLIYIRRKHLYIKHVVHALHVHSFAYLMYAICLLIIFKVLTENNFPTWDVEAIRWTLSIIFFVGVSTYVYVSFLKVYKQGWFKTLIKFNIVGFIYSFFLYVFFGIEVFVSFWYY